MPTDTVDFRDLVGKMAIAALVWGVLTDERPKLGSPGDVGGASCEPECQRKMPVSSAQKIIIGADRINIGEVQERSS